MSLILILSNLLELCKIFLTRPYLWNALVVKLFQYGEKFVNFFSIWALQCETISYFLLFNLRIFTIFLKRSQLHHQQKIIRLRVWWFFHISNFKSWAFLLFSSFLFNFILWLSSLPSLYLIIIIMIKNMIFGTKVVRRFCFFNEKIS